MTDAPTLTSATPAQTTPATPTSGTQPVATDAPAFWGASLPADLQSDPTIAKYTSLEAAARGLAGAVKLVGERPENLLKLPAAGDEAGLRSALHKLGMPETRDGYALAQVDGAAGLDTSSDLAKVFTEACFEAGVLPKSMQGVYEKVGGFLNEYAAQQAQAAEARETEHMALLSKELGAALDDTLTRAEVVANHYGVTEALNEAGLGTHPGVVKILAQVFPTLQEASSGGRGDRGVGAKSPAEYTAEANELQRQAMKEPVRSRQLELAQQAFRLRQLANAGK